MVQRIVSGKMLDEPLVDVNADSTPELGMLEIADSSNVANPKIISFRCTVLTLSGFVRVYS